MVSVVFKSVRYETLAEASDSLSSVVDSFADFSGPASDVPFFEDEIIEEDSPGK